MDWRLEIAHLDRFCVAWAMTHPSASGGITPQLIFKYNGTKYKSKIITCSTLS